MTKRSNPFTLIRYLQLELAMVRMFFALVISVAMGLGGTALAADPVRLIFDTDIGNDAGI